MNQRNDAQTRLWIRNPDSLGNVVDHRLIEAAHRVWERARLVVTRYLAEDTEAAEILEAAVDSASRAMGNQQSIQFFEAYLLKSVARESVRRLRKNQRTAYVHNADLERLAGGVPGSLRSRRYRNIHLAGQFKNCETWLGESTSASERVSLNPYVCHFVAFMASLVVLKTKEDKDADQVKTKNHCDSNPCC